MVNFCKMMIYPGVFSFQNFNFLGLLGVKGQKMVQNDKKVCQSPSISQELYIIWSSFVVHMGKRIISPVFFFIFLKLWFSRLLKGWKSKKCPKMTKKKNVLHFISQEAYTRWSWFWYTYVKWWYFQMLFSFFQHFDFLGC